MDVIIPYTLGSWWQNNELRFCLRSLQKNFLDMGEVYLVGPKPKFIKNVRHIPIDDPWPQSNKAMNIVSKILTMCRRDDISKDFLFCSDDQVLLKPMKAKDIKPYYTYDLRFHKMDFENEFWKQCMINTRDTLLKEGKPCFNYESHCGKLINRKKFEEIIPKYDYHNTLYPTHSLYFNNVVKDPQSMPVNYRVFFDKERMDVGLIDGKTWLGYSDLGLSFQLQGKLRELFPTKSRFEK